MLTKSDKKFIIQTVSTIVTNAITENNKALRKDMVDLFNATNEHIDMVYEKLNSRLDDANNRIERVLDKLGEHQSIINNYERRIKKIEEKTLISN